MLYKIVVTYTRSVNELINITLQPLSFVIILGPKWYLSEEVGKIKKLKRLLFLTVIKFTIISFSPIIFQFYFFVLIDFNVKKILFRY